MVKKYFGVNDVVQRLGISRQTLLRYEKRGIFPRPKRNCVNHWREYTDIEVDSLKQILGRF
ncbi:MAG: MerR family transcriptional regulator [Candidatus Omnitrophota bacterium]